jgi:L-fuculose-phosphate aldolase
MNMKEYKKQVIDACIEMTERKLTLETWGNISLRDPETGYIYLTPSGMDYNTCVADDIIVFDNDGNLVEGKRKPSIEKDMHLGIYFKRKDVNAVIHTHPTHSMIFAVTGQGIPAVTDEFAQLIGKRAECANYALPGTKELAENTIDSLGGGKAVLLCNHGAVCVGHDLKSAFRVAEVLEKTAYIYLRTQGIGTPRIIPDQDVEVMMDFVSNKYGQR